MTDIKKVIEYLLFLFKQDATSLDEPFVDISNLKLQKMLYYCQAYTLAMTGKVLFKEDIQAWDYGPVIREVYENYRKYADLNIPVCDIADSCGLENKTEEAIIRLVKAAKGSYSAFALKDMTHSELPWKSAYEKGKNNIIPVDTIKSYFEEKICREGTEEQEDMLWASISKPLTVEDIGRLKTIEL